MERRVRESTYPTTVAGLRPGDRARLVAVRAPGWVRQRLLDLGLVPPVEVRLERRALGGDPLWLRVGVAQLALRRREARCLVIER